MIKSTKRFMNNLGDILKNSFFDIQKINSKISHFSKFLRKLTSKDIQLIYEKMKIYLVFPCYTELIKYQSLEIIILIHDNFLKFHIQQVRLSDSF